MIGATIERCQDEEDRQVMSSPALARAPRASYHHGNLEQAFILAATEMIRENGVEHISLRAVAAKVGVSPSAAYHYFPDKDALISGLGEALFEQFADSQELALAAVSLEGDDVARARFRALGRSYFEWAINEINLFRLIFGVFCSLDPSEVEQKRVESRAWAMLHNCVEDLFASGAMNPAMRPYGELLAWSVVHGATSLILDGHLPEDAFEVVLDGLELSLGISNGISDGISK